MIKYKNIKNAHIKSDLIYKDLYETSIKDSDSFWKKISDRVEWFKQPKKISDVDFKTAKIKWFQDGQINASYNCLDRHIENGYGDKVALIWEGNSPNHDKKFTYKQLLFE